MQTSFYDPGEQRATRVKSLFAQIAAHYDLVNDIQSLGLHRRWKKRVADLARVAPGQRALDLCCGTGDIALALAAGGAAVAGLDFTNEMLVRAADRRDSPTSSNYQDRIWFVRGDGQMLPFPDNTFDAVTVGYGLRNLADWQCGIDEMRRVAKPGGRLVILEFGKPPNTLWRTFYFSYLRLIVPAFGVLFCRNAGAYRYILESLDHYPSQLEVAEAMRRAGLEKVQLHNIIGGAMSIHYAEKQRSSDHVD